MAGDPTYYEVLGVSPRATFTEIRAAYIGLAKRYHPDIASDALLDPSAVGRIGEAYNCLRHPARREAYDVELRQRPVALPILFFVPSSEERGRPARRTRYPLWFSVPLGIAILTSGWACWLILKQPAAGPAPSPTVQASDTGKAGPIDRATTIEAIVDLGWISAAGGGVDPEGAERYSRKCFESVRAVPSQSILDYCAAFDSGAAASVDTPFFATTARQQRYAAEAGVVGGSTMARWGAIDAAVRSELAESRVKAVVPAVR